MRTPAHTGHRKSPIQNTNSSSSLKYNRTSVSDFTTKNSISTSYRSLQLQKENTKDIKEADKIESPLKLSRSKSDYCIRYDEKNTDIRRLQHIDGKLKQNKMARAASEKKLKKNVTMERMSGEGKDTPCNRLDKILHQNASYCDNCKSRISTKQTTGRPTKDTLNVAPPPSGYFIRDDISTEESGFDKKKTCCSLHTASKQDLSLCTFGYNSWSKSRDGDNSMILKFPTGIDSADSGPNLYPKLQSPYHKKRRNNSGLKESPRKKVKKTKKRKTSHKLIEYKDQSPKKTKVVDDNTRNQSKKSFDLKTGIVFKHVSRNERSHPIRYKQKILNPNNSKFFQTMGSLPVSMDSVLYYYEPQGKTKIKRNTSQNRNVEKTFKARGICGHDRPDSKGLSWMKIYDNKGAVYLNTNTNANNSDNDQIEPDDVSPIVDKPKLHVTMNVEPTFNEITGMVTHGQGLQAQAQREYDNMAQTDSVGDLPANDYSIYSDTLEGSIINKPGCEKPTLVTAVESNNTQYGLDLMVDDILDSAVKEEAEYERRLMENTSDKPAGETGQIKVKTPKSATFSINLENNVMIDSPQKHDDKNDESTKGPSSKPVASRPDLVKMCKALKRVSSSSPNLSMARKGDRSFGGKQTNPSNSGESPLRSKSTPQTNRLASGTHGLRCFEHSPDTKSPQTTPSSKTGSKISNLHGPIKRDTCGSEIEENGLTENLQQDRGKLKQVREEPTSGSILRKSKSVPQGEKRTQPQQVKSQRKRKPIGNLKKSQSMSPGPFKGSGASGSCVTPTHSGQSSSECLRKKCPVNTAAKKNKKKVRIVVDWNSFQAEHLQKVTTVNGSPKEVKETGLQADYCEERNSKNCDFDLEGESSCDLVYDVEIESKEKPHLERNEANSEDEPENEMRRDLDMENEDDEKIEEDEPCNIVCGFSESMKEHEKAQSINTAIKEVAGETKGKVKKAVKGKKFGRSREDKTTAERGWDSNFVVKKDDSKTKLGSKRKRYQLKKPGEHIPEKTKTAKLVVKEITEIDQMEDKDFDTPVDIEKTLGQKMKKSLSPQISKAQKSAQIKRPNLSPTGLRRKIVEVDPRGEGSSVDAPAFNARRESVVRLSKSSTLANAVKPSAKEAAVNAPRQRVKQARESFARINRNKPNASPMHMDKTSQASPQISRSTDLDLACSKKQLSPNRGAISMVKPTRTESKIGASKPKAKSESDGVKDVKEDVAEESASESPPRSPRVLDHNFTDPVEMSVINLGLHWVAQRIMKRLSFFQSKPENDEDLSDSPVFENMPIVENEKI